MKFKLVIIPILLAAKFASACPPEVVINTSKEKWLPYDQEMLIYARKRCKQIWPDASCLKIFKKYEPQSYSVICGADKK